MFKELANNTFTTQPTGPPQWKTISKNVGMVPTVLGWIGWSSAVNWCIHVHFYTYSFPPQQSKRNWTLQTKVKNQKYSVTFVMSLIRHPFSVSEVDITRHSTMNYSIDRKQSTQRENKNSKWWPPSARRVTNKRTPCNVGVQQFINNRVSIWKSSYSYLIKRIWCYDAQSIISHVWPTGLP